MKIEDSRLRAAGGITEFACLAFVFRIHFFRGTKESGSGERCWGAGERRRDSFSISFFSRNEWVHHADSLFVFTFFEERIEWTVDGGQWFVVCREG